MDTEKRDVDYFNRAIELLRERAADMGGNIIETDNMRKVSGDEISAAVTVSFDRERLFKLLNSSD